MTKNPPAGGIAIALTDQQIVLGARALAQAMFDMAMKGGAPAPVAVAVPQDSPPLSLGHLPAIGAEWEGGIYAGLSIHENQVVALVLLPGDQESITWTDAMAWAEKQGGVLPSRIDQLVLFKNAKAQFKEAWYWSCEQHAALSGYAWGQGFITGGQYYWRKVNTSRARAVRRLAIQ